MYIDSFKVFCDLVKTSSFSKSAVLNNITQSAVSQQVRSLEIKFDCTLVERGRRNLSLTPEGLAFHKACEKIIAIWNDFEARLKEIKNVVEGEVRIASIYSIGLHELPARLKAFGEKNPDVQVRVEYCTSQQVYEMIESGKADLGLVAYPTKRSGVLFEVFDEDQLVLICPPKHPLAAKKKVALSALKGERFLSFDPEAPTRKAIDRCLRDAQVKVVNAGEFDNVETVKRAVEIESGISIVPLQSIKQEVKAGQLVAVEIEGQKLTRPLGLVYSRTRSRPAGLKELIASLKETAK